MIARTIPNPPLPLVLRSVSDIELMLSRAREVRNLPRSGIKISFELREQEAKRFEDSVRAFVLACGCGEGAGAALLIWLAGGFYCWRLWSLGANTLSVAAGAATAFALGLIGAFLVKIIAIRVAQWRFQRAARALLKAVRATPS
ncbi:hypothetical protein NT2_05_01830 [Caenibius tardaugens NBRC 16725]|uniref:Uncharacterized protein n=1 Tax=Caenibius tardaugens NBRC 16725 TaxID=1219035 RepID=U3A3D5_9SPHN|nr:hypothetical protein [Caenibius tardaugens]AZI36611.1 hypothetical protein EGO55_12155 [Caenibius tardaugens NBRC 16725]GAD49263.1 hypothetical protein NT2_05_01830 [Caenibius tardaugens NBRC 16725]